MSNSLLILLVTNSILISQTHSFDVDQLFFNMTSTIFHKNLPESFHINLAPFFKLNYSNNNNKEQNSQEISINGFYGEYDKKLHSFNYVYSKSENISEIHFQQEINSKSSTSKIFLPLIFHSKEHYNFGLGKIFKRELDFTFIFAPFFQNLSKPII